MDTGMNGSSSVRLCSKRCPLDVHDGCATESVGLMTESVLQFVISEFVDFEKLKAVKLK